MPIEIGATAPVFTVQDSHDHMLDLKALLQKGPVVLAFFPKANTSGCSREMRAFVEQKEMLNKHQATLIAVSYDSAQKLQSFAKELSATFSFVPDPDGVLMRLYDAKMPIVTVAKRKTFVIGQDGKIAYIESGGDAIALKGVQSALQSLDKDK